MSVVSIILPLLMIALLGYGSSRSQWLSREQINGISQFAFYLCIPALLVSTLWQVPLSASLQLPVLLSFYVPVVSCFAAVLLFCHGWLKRPWSKSAVLALSASYSNSLLVGLPVIIAAFGQTQMARVFLIIPFHSAILFGLTFALSGQGDRRQYLKDTLLNPVVTSIAIGLLANALNIPLPSWLGDPLAMLAAPAITCALFVLGANLHYYRLTTSWAPAIGLSMVKLLLLPAMVFVCGHGFGLSELDIALTVLLAASPLGVNAYLIAVKLNQDADITASSVVISSGLSVLTVASWLTLLT
ncbi:AEC family transporter [Shewanella sp. NIFS-20-20]|uniref:AEC family transporter n=1 Tax=Shewanella sp. NIFS-20-20 TaxID=2853806 RepID=UPI001C48E3C0|nr:AEC family transporter [Shewanella sp. NIFS-20-20]MBV7315775.1 AEC family transporter [Shewanella sp. NIFS-20-20]